VLQVPDIPRTKSNKIVELAVRNVVHGRPVKNVEALANPEALRAFQEPPRARLSAVGKNARASRRRIEPESVFMYHSPSHPPGL